MGPVFLHFDLIPPNLKNHTEFSVLRYREGIGKLERLQKKSRETEWRARVWSERKKR